MIIKKKKNTSKIKMTAKSQKNLKRTLIQKFTELHNTNLSK